MMLLASDIFLHQIRDYGVDFPTSQLGIATLRHLSIGT